MKLTYFQLAQHLTKKLMPAYLVTGEDEFLRQDAIDQIRQAAKLAGFHSRARFLAESSSDWDSLHSFLYATSMFSDKQLLEFHFQQSSPNKDAAGLLSEYMQQPLSDRVLIIDLGKADSKRLKASWIQAIEKTGIVINIWPVPREQLPLWIIERGKKAGLAISKEAAALLSEYSFGNLAKAAEAILKLTLLNTQTIDVSTITHALSDESRHNIFDLVETAFQGDHARTLHILDNLKADGTDPVLVLWALVRELRLIATIAREMKQGQALETLLQKHKIFAKRQPPIRRFLSSTSEEKCHDLLIKAASIDRVIKGAEAGHPWQNLQLFCLRLV